MQHEFQIKALGRKLRRLADKINPPPPPPLRFTKAQEEKTARIMRELAEQSQAMRGLFQLIHRQESGELSEEQFAAELAAIESVSRAEHDAFLAEWHQTQMTIAPPADRKPFALEFAPEQIPAEKAIAKTAQAPPAELPKTSCYRPGRQYRHDELPLPPRSQTSMAWSLYARVGGGDAWERTNIA